MGGTRCHPSVGFGGGVQRPWAQISIIATWLVNPKVGVERDGFGTVQRVGIELRNENGQRRRNADEHGARQSGG